MSADETAVADHRYSAKRAEGPRHGSHPNFCAAHPWALTRWLGFVRPIFAF